MTVALGNFADNRLGINTLTVKSTDLTVTALDVGQGASTLFLSGNRAALVDCGGSGGDSAGDVAADWLAALGRDSLDLLALTHLDDDHFNGVAQIVSRLFEWGQPTRAYFGEKDFQQIAVIRRMVENEGGFNGLEIVPCPIVREEDGLALSSRNVRLTPEDRKAAPFIHKALAKSVEYARDHSVEDTIRFVTEELNANPRLRVEYYSIVNPLTMQPVTSWGDTRDGAQGCATVYCGDVRLIDNIKYN